eukprot:CAMPEP_0203853398 /NCGR_PEP_ID=MMETSP0359-20131031/8518_1 /ASSEMBLY_ACC=CAM_ASM_000338 /TAXON_ID=268821 /ORGANISM="Scrippsiella Hangoei, Strain SHTV-5" /LENGTH=43 /DNA_ID= /DNA_START= /DNA_END= /DNA_ORIENTATION=
MQDEPVYNLLHNDEHRGQASISDTCLKAVRAMSSTCCWARKSA